MKKYLSRLTVFFFLGSLLMANRCYTDEDIENRILIKNNLNFDIYCVPSFIYPDTTLVFTNKDVIKASESAYSIPNNSAERIGYISLCYENEFHRVTPNDTLILFVLNKSIVDQYDWEYIIENDEVISRIYLSYSDLMKSTCQIEIN